MDNKIYVAIWQDHHCETTVHVFSNLEKAKDWTLQSIREHLGDHDHLDKEVHIRTLTPEMNSMGWKFYVTYDYEGSNIHIIETQIDKELNA